MLKVVDKAAEFVTASPDKKAADWLEGQIAKAHDSVITVVDELTPARARVLLNRNDGNRKVRDAVVDGYAADIKHGRWQFNGEPIIISSDGHLNDGQHRCAAVVKADVAVQAIFIFGIERKTQTTLDQGKMRSVGDFLSMRGYNNSVKLGAAANFAIQINRENKRQIAHGGSGRATKSEIQEFVEATPDLVTSVEVCDRKNAEVLGGRALIAFLHWLFWQKAGRKDADTFINALIDGFNLQPMHPVAYARAKLINNRMRLRPNARAEVVIKAWNVWRRGGQIERMELSGGDLPEVEA